MIMKNENNRTGLKHLSCWPVEWKKKRTASSWAPPDLSNEWSRPIRRSTQLTTELVRTKWTRGGRARGGVLVRRAEPPLPTTTRPHKRKEVRPARCTRSRPANRRTRHTGRTSFRRYALLCLLYYTKCPWTRSFFGRLTRRLLSTPSHFFPQNGVNFFCIYPVGLLFAATKSRSFGSITVT